MRARACVGGWWEERGSGTSAGVLLEGSCRFSFIVVLVVVVVIIAGGRCGLNAHYKRGIFDGD